LKNYELKVRNLTHSNKVIQEKLNLFILLSDQSSKSGDVGVWLAMLMN